MSLPPAKGAKGTLPWRGDQHADRWRDRCPDKCLVYSPHYERATQIKESCVDNAVGLDDQQRCARQPEVQSKVDVLGGPPATAAEAAVQAWRSFIRLLISSSLSLSRIIDIKQHILESISISTNLHEPQTTTIRYCVLLLLFF